MESLEDRLVAAESHFLSALSKGDDALVAFDRHWESLMADADLAIESSHVDPNLPILVHHTATRIATLADISTELYVNYDNITTQFLGEIDILMSQLTLTEHLPVHRRITSSPKTSPEPEDPPRSLTSKRRRDCIGSSLCDIKPRKRSCVVIQRCDGATKTITQLKTPLSTNQPLSQSPQCASSHLHGLKRKRCSSDADCTATGGPQKRLYAGPRLHAVSDSYRTLLAADPGSYLPSSSLTATQHADSIVETVDGRRNTPDLPSSNRGSEPCGSPRLAPLPCTGFSEAGDWVNLTFDFLEPESPPSFSPAFDGMHLFLQSLMETSEYELSQPLQPSTSEGYGHSFRQTSSLVPSLVVDSMPSPTSSSYPSTPSPQPSLDLGPAFLQFEPSLADISLDQNLLTLQSMLSSAPKETHAHEAHDALLLMRPEPAACDSAWSSLFLPTDSMLTFPIPSDPILSSFAMSPETSSSDSEDDCLAVSLTSAFGGENQIGSLCPIGAI